MSKKAKRADVVPTWGVDLTSVGLRAAQMDIGKDGRPTIVAWDIVDFTEESEDINSLSRFQLIARGLFHLRKRHDFTRSRVFASVRGEAVFNRTVEIPSINDESLEKILHYEALHQIPYPLDQVFWDRRVISIGDDGGIRATLYAVQKEIIEERIRKLAKAGFPVEALQVRPIALNNFCAAEHLLEEGTVVVDVDYMGVQVLIHHDQHSWFRVVPVGGVDMVQRMKDELGIDHRKAVRILRGEEKVPDAETVPRLRGEVAKFLADEVGRIVDFYLAARPQVEVNNVVLFRSHRCVPPMVKALKARLGLPVFKPAGFRRIAVHPDVVSAGIQDYFCELARAVGLALQGVGKAEVDIRLFPPQLEKARSRNILGYVAGVLLLFSVLGAAAFERVKAVGDIEKATVALRAVEKEARDKDDLPGQAELKSALERLQALAGPSADRKGPLPLLELMVSKLSQSSARPMHLASLRVGEEIGLPKNEARLVLATEQNAPEAQLDRALDALLEGVKGGAGEPGVSLREFEVLGSWSAGGIVSHAPAVVEEKPLRWRFRHRSYRLILGGG